MNERMIDNYESRHGEIFNPIEQTRLRKKVFEALSFMQTQSEIKSALDYGCGTGNLTKYFIEAGLKVISADVSKKYLNYIDYKYNDTGLSETMLVNGKDLFGIKDQTFDIAASYSVLHHIPDYLRIVREMHRVTKKGGIIFIDHELNEAYWKPNDKYKEFCNSVLPKTRPNFRRYLKISNYINGLRFLLNPRWKPEGDIHVWPDDHIQWEKIENALIEMGSEIVLRQDYLLFRREYCVDTYMKYKNICSDIRILLARKN